MEKRKSCAVFLTHRNNEPVGKELKKLDWDGLVDEVFKEEVDQFYIESGVQSLHIRQNINAWAVTPTSTSRSVSGVFSTTSNSSRRCSSPSWSSSNTNKSCGQRFQDTTAHWQDKREKDKKEDYWTSSSDKKKNKL